VTKRFGDVEVVHGVDLEVADREFVVLVGPSGCGKSTLLRMIAGLEDITSGEIAIDGRVVNELDPRDRDIAMVFQDYALYPHMTVFENMGFSLRYRGVDRREIRRRVEAAARILDIEPYMARMPRQLSGGQRQRVAMGRAIVRDPKVFLFDEPLSNLDAKLRVQMRTELKRLRERVATTAIYVTHDQVEAMTLADRIVILNQGLIEQVGTPEEVYDHPASTFVAAFIGAPPMNLLPATALPADRLPRTERSPQDLLVGVRPEHLLWHDGASAPLIEGRASVVEPLGSDTLVSLDVAGASVIARLPPRIVRRAGEAVRLTVDPANLHLFDKATGRRQTIRETTTPYAQAHQTSAHQARGEQA
jgi:ABC-type sugar transport system ATPase subunit